MNKIIGIPNQQKNNVKTQQAQIQKAQEAEQKKRANNYYVGMRLEYAQKYPLPVAMQVYEYVMSKAEYPEVSFWHQAAMIWMEKQDHAKVKKINDKEVTAIYNFLKYEG